ncbi:GNAT family N-acetyltransferase [Pseudonocardia spinosispora]|uniref:GNAT family N-acetyltransferase n=1 Tax=Pseudonocardia spinosispora TaxID=103441 RepID=UPI000410F63C|nr:GNAT family N-acetyltransferase [Pseudonocardia spinosispora]
MHIRSATVQDAAGIAEVQVASWREAYRGLLPAEVLDNLSPAHRGERWSSILADEMPRTATFVATEADIVGFASIGPCRGDHSDGELYALYLRPDRWRQGIGSRLHTAALAAMRDFGFADAILWALVGNERAFSFYRRHDWREDGAERIEHRPDGTELPEVRFHRRLDLPYRSER